MCSNNKKCVKLYDIKRKAVIKTRLLIIILKRVSVWCKLIIYYIITTLKQNSRENSGLVSVI